MVHNLKYEVWTCFSLFFFLPLRVKELSGWIFLGHWRAYQYVWPKISGGYSKTNDKVAAIPQCLDTKFCNHRAWCGRYAKFALIYLFISLLPDAYAILYLKIMHMLMLLLWTIFSCSMSSENLLLSLMFDYFSFFLRPFCGPCHYLGEALFAFGKALHDSNRQIADWDRFFVSPCFSWSHVTCRNGHVIAL